MTEVKSDALVSVCIPTFNNASMVGDAVASVRRQTHPDLEIVVLDNASQDDTATVVRHHANTDPRIRYVRHPRNIGMAGNFNSALAAARSPLVMILCADDALEPDAIRLLAAALHDCDGAVLAAGGRIIVDAMNRETSRIAPRRARTCVPGASMIETCFAAGNRLGEPSAVLFRRDAAARGFDPAFHQFVDVEMWVHLLKQGDAMLLAEPVARIRRHAGQWSEANIGNGRLVRDKQAFFRLLAPELARRLGLLQKLRWDARMSSSIARTRLADSPVDLHDVREVFFPSLLPAAVGVSSVGLRLLQQARSPAPAPAPTSSEKPANRSS